QCIKQGYLFNIVNTNNVPNTKYRIFKSQTSGSNFGLGGTIASTNIATSAFTFSSNTPVWLRASVSGTAPVTLKFEYSADSITWNTAINNYQDNSAPLFSSGSTQFVWGLAATSNDIYLDNITINS